MMFLALVLAAATSTTPVSADTQKALETIYDKNCAMVLNPTQQNFDASVASLSPDFTETDTRGVVHKRGEVVAMAKQQMQLFKATSCNSTFASFAAPDASTVVVVTTNTTSGYAASPDGTKHSFTAVNTTTDTWKSVKGTWLETASQDQHVLVTIDGKVIEDATAKPGQ